jgi:hypothetical protein
MKGQFFVIATVIMIYTLMTMIQYIYDFSDINLVQLKKMTEIYYIQYIKDALNKTVVGSYSSLDCNKLTSDINAVEILLKNVMISRGINLTINHQINCPNSPLAYFNFSLSNPKLYTFTEIGSSGAAQPPSNWLTGWSYRKQHNITNSIGADVNYTVNITVVNGTSADSGNIVNITKARSDFGDIRFTDSSGSLLNYWIESVNIGVNATFWVQIAGNLTSTNQTTYIYYGNSIVTNISSINNTFIFADDFELGNLGKWTTAGSDWSANNAVFKYGSWSAKAVRASGGRTLTKDLNNSQLTKGQVIFYAMTPDTSHTNYIFVPNNSVGADMYMLVMQNTGHFQYYDGAWKNLPTDTTYSASIWYKVRIAWDYTTLKYAVWINDVNVSAGGISGVLIGSWLAKPNAYDPDVAGAITYLDNYLVMKYTSPEPSHSNWGSEEP